MLFLEHCVGYQGLHLWLFGLVFKQAAFYFRDTSVSTTGQSVLSLVEGRNVERAGKRTLRDNWQICLSTRMETA